jgi:tetratricopeptide (TPR) repeat protein
MPQVAPVRPVNRHRRLFVAGAVFVLLIAIGVGVAAYYHWNSVPSATTSAAKADNLNAQGNYTQALSLLQNANQRSMSNSDKELLLSRLAATSADMGSNHQALEYFQQLNQLQPNNYSTLMNIGNLAVQLGDKQDALTAYQQALVAQRAQKPGIYYQDDIDQLTQTIAELQQ